MSNLCVIQDKSIYKHISSIILHNVRYTNIETERDRKRDRETERQRETERERERQRKKGELQRQRQRRRKKYFTNSTTLWVRNFIPSKYLSCIFIAKCIYFRVVCAHSGVCRSGGVL